MLKGDLIKRDGVWHVIYSPENSGRIYESVVSDYSAKIISEKKGGKAKFFKDVSFELTNGEAFVKLIPDNVSTKNSKEEEKENNSHNGSYTSSKLDIPFSSEEKEIMNLIIEARSKFYQLEQNYPSDITDLEFHLNGVQRIMALRVFRRDYPNII